MKNGFQLGVALGFLLPPMMVGSHDGDIIAIGADLSQLFYILAGLSSAVSIVVLIGKKNPKKLDVDFIEFNKKRQNN